MPYFQRQRFHIGYFSGAIDTCSRRFLADRGCAFAFTLLLILMQFGRRHLIAKPYFYFCYILFKAFSARAKYLSLVSCLRAFGLLRSGLFFDTIFITTMEVASARVARCYGLHTAFFTKPSISLHHFCISLSRARPLYASFDRAHVKMTQ